MNMIDIKPIKTELVFSDEQKQLARFSKALGHPVRVYILHLLAKQSCCYSGDLSDELPIAKSTLSQYFEGAEECRINSRNDRITKDSLLFE